MLFVLYYAITLHSIINIVKNYLLRSQIAIASVRKGAMIECMIHRHLIVISAPSGAGKTSLVHALLQSVQQLTVSVSYTTRDPRADEQNGTHYFFVSSTEFAKLQSLDQFIETADIFENNYGTHRQRVVEQLSKDQDVILEIDWQGHQSVRSNWKGPLTSVFILPPSLQVLEERLIKRGDAPKSIAQRIGQAHADIQHAIEYDYVVTNDDFDTALDQLQAIITSVRQQNPLWVQKNQHWFEKK